MKELTAASLTIKDAGEMTPQGRKDVARWLRRQARFLTDHGEDFHPRYRAQFVYLEKLS